jgi:hypothetical protein
MNDTIFILPKLIYNVCLKFHVKTRYGWGARGGKKKKKDEERLAGKPNDLSSSILLQNKFL